MFEEVNSAIDVVVIGSSTGGSVVLESLLSELPASFMLPILITQHIPDTFNDRFVKRLNEKSLMMVKEAKEGDVIEPSVVYISSNKKTMLVTQVNEQLVITYTECSDRAKFCPSIDETLKSFLPINDYRVLGIILSGIGSDGTAGASALKGIGADIWAQDEKGCIAFGMPKSAIEAGVVDKIVPATRMVSELMRL